MSTPTILRHLGGSDPPAIIEGFVLRIALSRHVYLFAARTIQLSLLPLNLGPKLLRDPHHFFNEWFVGVLAVDVTPLVVFYTFAEEDRIVACGGKGGGSHHVFPNCQWRLSEPSPCSSASSGGRLGARSIDGHDVNYVDK